MSLKSHLRHFGNTSVCKWQTFGGSERREGPLEGKSKPRGAKRGWTCILFQRALTLHVLGWSMQGKDLHSLSHFYSAARAGGNKPTEHCSSQKESSILSRGGTRCPLVLTLHFNLLSFKAYHLFSLTVSQFLIIKLLLLGELKEILSNTRPATNGRQRPFIASGTFSSSSARPFFSDPAKAANMVWNWTRHYKLIDTGLSLTSFMQINHQYNGNGEERGYLQSSKWRSFSQSSKCDAGNIVSADERETPYMLFMSSVCIILHQYLWYGQP